MYKSIYGYSCIENHILALLRKNKVDIADLYINSLIPISKIYKKIFIDEELQEYFSGTAKIQDNLKEIKAISLKLHKQDNIHSLLTKIKSCSKNQFVFVRIKPKFAKQKLFTQGLRNDHYVIISYYNNNFTLYNDIPYKEKLITYKEIEALYANMYFNFEFLNLNNIYNFKFTKVEDKLKGLAVNFNISEKDFLEIKDIGIKLRNFIGVLKLNRYRLNEIFHKHFNDNLNSITKYLEFLEKQYALATYYNLKKNKNNYIYYKIFQSVINLESKTINDLFSTLS